MWWLAIALLCAVGGYVFRYVLLVAFVVITFLYILALIFDPSLVGRADMGNMADILNSYAWGNNPYWLEWVCIGLGSTDCWT